jgi:hypothetical protein
MDLVRVFVAVGIVALVATAGDAVWYSLGVRHRMAAGLLHGAMLLTSVGGALGALAGRFTAGLPLGAIAGVAGALVYYALAPWLGAGAMIAAWGSLWLMLAALRGRWLLRPAQPWSEIALRGLVAAIAGGLAFALVVESLWGRPGPEGRHYGLQFAAWMVAWAPGILALVLRRSGRS